MTETQSFNPLNQVFVFNIIEIVEKYLEDDEGFNPLNQVFVFNHPYELGRVSLRELKF